MRMPSKNLVRRRKQPKKEAAPGAFSENNGVPCGSLKKPNSKFQKSMKVHDLVLEDDDDDAKKRKPSKFRLSKKLTIVFLALCIISTIALALILYFTLNKSDRESVVVFEDCLTGHEQYQLSSPSKLGKYQHAAVAADSVVCSTVGKEILLANGSAVDAAIATGLCNGLFTPQSMGIGGGHFMLIYLRDKQMAIGIDARERAPIDSTEDMFVNKSNLSFEGGLASGVPGEIAGYWLAHQIGGHLPWEKLFEPSIKFCREGIKVSAALASAIKQYEQRIHSEPGLTKIFVNSLTNQTYKENDTIKMLALANTLEKIGKQGAKAFYDGDLSASIISENKINSGIFKLDDLKNYKPANRTPDVTRLNNKYRMFTMPAPSSGILVSFILNVMSKYNFTADSVSNPEKAALFYHRLIETYKHAFAKRSFLGDMDFVDTEGLKRNLTDPNYINQIIKLINDSTTFDQAYYGPGWPVQTDSGTSHISIIAPNGDAVALTCTINTFFGAKYAGEETGIIYNNEMDDFSTPGTVNYFGVPASEANYIKPGKRPMSSMTPIIVVDDNGDVRLVVGASGGTKIISAVALTAIRNLWLDKNIKESIDESRLHHQLFPSYVEIETGFPSDVQNLLMKKKHETKCFNYGGSTVQGVERRPNNEIWANCDARKGGQPDGF